MKHMIYFDYQATTPCDPEVIDAMIPYLNKNFGNPHSKNHSYGWRAEKAVEEAREKIALSIGAGDPSEIVFTSGATESNNIAIQGIYEFHKENGKNHIITCTTEHKSVLQICKFLETKGCKVTYLQVNKEGLINLKELEDAICEKTILVSIMYVNNEIGVIQPIKAIGEICKRKKVFFHCDGAQALGKVKLDVEEDKIDMLSLSGHKIYAPQGIGCLYVRKRPRVRISPIIQGGDQERGIRSGTTPTALCVAMGKAAEMSEAKRYEEWQRILLLRNKIINEVKERIKEVYVNGSIEHRVPHNLNLSFAYIEGESLMMSLKDIALSSGSACTSSSLESSYVLQAIGINELLSHSSIRIGLGRFTTDEEVDKLINGFEKSVKKLREMSPLYEMAQEGTLENFKWKE